MYHEVFYFSLRAFKAVFCCPASSNEWIPHSQNFNSTTCEHIRKTGDEEIIESALQRPIAWKSISSRHLYSINAGAIYIHCGNPVTSEWWAAFPGIFRKLIKFCAGLSDIYAYAWCHNPPQEMRNIRFSAPKANGIFWMSHCNAQQKCFCDK